jgi:uncharacterized membrane protein YdjX (TVP38/TMEM64 family)
MVTSEIPMEGDAARHRRRRLAVFLAGGFFLVGLAVVAAMQPPETWLRIKETAGRTMAAVRALGAGWFFAAFALLPAVGFPVSVFVLAAGPLFAPVIGLPAVLALAGASMAASMTISYGLSRYLLRPWVERLLAYLGYGIPVVPPGKRRMFVFLVRVTPGPPYVFQSFLLGLAGVPFRTYLAISWLTATANIVLVIVCGNALMNGRGGVALAAVAGAVAVFFVIRAVRGRMAVKAVSKEEGAA